MRYNWIDEYLLAKPGVEKDLQPEWNWIRYKIGGKMFAALCLDEHNEPYYINLKLDPAEGDFFRRQYEDVLPGYYSNKVHWNSVRPDGAVPDELLREMLDKSYSLVLAGFSKKRQRELMSAAVTAYCGLDCAHCEFAASHGCKGCIATKGYPFHIEEGQEPCAVAACALEKGVAFCGDCENFPCELLISFSDDPQYGDDPKGARIQRCRALKAAKNGKKAV